MTQVRHMLQYLTLPPAGHPTSVVQPLFGPTKNQVEDKTAKGSYWGIPQAMTVCTLLLTLLSSHRQPYEPIYLNGVEK